MERKYLKDLLNWYSNPERKPLLVTGARQVGKTYLIEKLFAEAYFKNKYLLIDCSDDSEFTEYVYKTNNLEKMIDYIRVRYDFTPDKDHLLIFDEAQECLPIIRMMKQFCERKREIPVIVSGSLVRISMKRLSRITGNSNNGFIFPVGKINELSIYPLTFEEFLLNYNKQAYNYLIDHFTNRIPVDIGIHNKLIDMLNDYLFVGGMPEAVNTFIVHKNDEVNRYVYSYKTLKEIYSNYLNDMELYQASPESLIRSRAIYRSIYSQLNKENKNFKFANVESGLRNREALNPMEWLLMADIVMKSNLLKETITLPLIESEETLFRLYLADMGLFTYQSGLDSRSFILNKENALSGIYYENYIATELHAHERKLFYWKGKRNSEFEFILDINGHVIPLDSKKNKGSLNSLDEFRAHNKKDMVIKVSKNQYGYDKDKNILTLPFYYFSFFLDKIDESDYSDSLDNISM